MNPERVRRERNPFRVNRTISYTYPGFSLRSNPGLRLANAFGVIKLAEIANAFGVIKLAEIANAFGVIKLAEIANAFGVIKLAEIANAFGVLTVNKSRHLASVICLSMVCSYMKLFDKFPRRSYFKILKAPTR